jgi:hypothetical protein
MTAWVFRAWNSPARAASVSARAGSSWTAPAQARYERAQRWRRPTDNRPDQAGKRAESAPSADHLARDRSILLGSAARCRRGTKVILIWGESLSAP